MKTRVIILPQGRNEKILLFAHWLLKWVLKYFVLLPINQSQPLLCSNDLKQHTAVGGHWPTSSWQEPSMGRPLPIAEKLLGTASALLLCPAYVNIWFLARPSWTIRWNFQDEHENIWKIYFYIPLENPLLHQGTTATGRKIYANLQGLFFKNQLSLLTAM